MGAAIALWGRKKCGKNGSLIFFESCEGLVSFVKFDFFFQDGKLVDVIVNIVARAEGKQVPKEIPVTTLHSKVKNKELSKVLKNIRKTRLQTKKEYEKEIAEHYSPNRFQYEAQTKVLRCEFEKVDEKL